MCKRSVPAYRLKFETVMSDDANLFIGFYICSHSGMNAAKHHVLSWPASPTFLHHRILTGNNRESRINSSVSILGTSSTNKSVSHVASGTSSNTKIHEYFHSLTYKEELNKFWWVKVDSACWISPSWWKRLWYALVSLSPSQLCWEQTRRSRKSLPSVSQDICLIDIVGTVMTHPSSQEIDAF